MSSEGDSRQGDRASGGTILIADGSSRDRQHSVLALTQAGYRVFQAADGPGALELASSCAPDLLLCDLLLPGLDGCELVRRLRFRPDGGNPRAILYTSSGRSEAAEILAAALGGVRFVSRPAGADALLSLVQGALLEPEPSLPAAGALEALAEAHGRLMQDELMAENARLRQQLEERKELEAVLRQNERRFAALVDSAMDAIVSIDSSQRIVLFNAAAESMFQCPAAEAVGSCIDRFIPARFRPGHGDHIRHFSDTGITSRGMGRLGAVSGLRADGVEFPIEASISQVEVAGQKFFTVILRDISERNRLESALQRMNAELELRVEERTAELMHANEALLRSNLELQQFAYIAAHDLQTPLRSISGFAQLLQKDYLNHLDQKAHDLIRRVVENTQRMHTLIHDLLVYSRIDSLGRPFRPTDFRQLFGEVVSGLEPVIRELQAEITRDELPVLLGDRGQLAQVLHNLVENGLKYHGDDPPRVHVSAEARQDEWIFSVRDNGIGIAPRHHGRIFEIFRRLHTQQAYPGTGIGLALCRRIIERHGGRIWVESEPGKGSTFRFALPINKLENPK